MKTALAAAALAALFVPASVQAMVMACTEEEKGRQLLSEQYGEEPVGMGISGGHLVLLFASRDGDSWTMARVDPNGVMCIVAAGESWEQVEFRPSGRSS